MSDIVVAGGLYGEKCNYPNVDKLCGSGGRAALAIARAGYKVEWHYYSPEMLVDKAETSVAQHGLTHFSHESEKQVNFCYNHPLSRPVYYPRIIPKADPFRISAKKVLRFGMMEGDAIVQAQYCVFDPQSHYDPVTFHQNGSVAQRLAIALNESEILRYASATDEMSAIEKIEKQTPGSTVLVKAGVHGCRVYEDAMLKGIVPPFWSERIHKIGTGDVFTAAFATHWMLEGRPVLDATDIASRCVAQYTETQTPTANINELDQEFKAIDLTKKGGLVYIAGPIFTMAELWIIDEARDAFIKLGVPVFSPYHDIGYGEPSKVVPADIAGLERASAVFAILDGCDAGTLFEIGYAVRMGIPVIALAQNPKACDLTMLKGSSNCRITDDFTTAIFQSAWLARG